MPRKLPLFSWVLYDFANTIFSMNIVTLYFSVWVTVNNGKADLWVGVANGLSAVFIVAALPLLGVWADAYRRKRMYLVLGTVGCCAFTALMGVAALSGLSPLAKVLTAVGCFVVGNFAYHAGLVFYNALLTSVAERHTLGRVSGYGVAAGYLGAILGLLMVMPFAIGSVPGWSINAFQGAEEKVAVIEKGDQRYEPNRPSPEVRFVDGPVENDPNYSYELRGSGKPVKVTTRDVFENGRRYYELKWEGDQEGQELWRRRSGGGRGAAFLPTALLFFLFALPCMLWVREKPGLSTEKIGIREGYLKIWKSLRETRKHPGVLRFFIGKYFYEDAISTVYIFMAVYASKVLKFSDDMQILFIMSATTFAMVGSFGAGFLTDRIGPKRTLMGVLCGWVIFLTAAALTAKASHFWVIGPGLGVLLGSMWTSSRPLLVTLVPEDAQGEFFAVSELTGKMSAVVGPILWGIIVSLAARAGLAELNQYRCAIASLVVMILIGFWIIRKVPDVRLGAKVVA